jgi:hypothetical protein
VWEILTKPLPLSHLAMPNWLAREFAKGQNHDCSGSIQGSLALKDTSELHFKCILLNISNLKINENSNEIEV